MDFSTWAAQRRAHFECVTDQTMTSGTGELAVLKDAMRYAMTGSGKRVRALLVYAAGELTGARSEDLDQAALAVEMVHAYSLVHDDLPCMDNDVLRRGKPTCHVQFGVAQAMLAGDALQPLAIELLVGMTLPAQTRIRLVQLLAHASGAEGMCAGQSIDLAHVGRAIDLPVLQLMHRLKTGALIEAAVRMGATCGEEALEQRCSAALRTYADRLGLAFQVVDDILDVTSSTATLGKTAGKDSASDKPTYVSLLGLEAARALAAQCHAQAVEALRQACPQGRLDASAMPLVGMAQYIIGRDH